MVDIVGGQCLIDSRFVDASHGDEGVGKYLLHLPAVGIEFGVATAGDACSSYMIDVEAISDGLHALSMEHGHRGEEVVLGTAQPIYEAQVVSFEKTATVGPLPDADEVHRTRNKALVVEVFPSGRGCGRSYGVVGENPGAFVVYLCAEAYDIFATDLWRESCQSVGT